MKCVIWDLLLCREENVKDPGQRVEVRVVELFREEIFAWQENLDCRSSPVYNPNSRPESYLQALQLRDHSNLDFNMSCCLADNDFENPVLDPRLT